MQVNLIRNTNQSRRGGRPIIRPLKVEFLAIAGGGGATDGNAGGGGGGAGGLITGSFCADKFTPYDIVIGDGGAPKTGGGGSPVQADNGENTTLFTVTALGGGAGTTPNATGVNGGSGGGNGNISGSALQPTAAYAGFGNDGGIETDSTNTSGGGGGGAGSKGGDTPSNGVGGDGGNGILLSFYTASAQYGPGGAGAGVNGFGTPGTGLDYGRGGNAGNVPTAATSGSAGYAIIKYFGGPKATGGTIVENGGVTYHIFESVGTGSFEVTKNDDNFAINNCNDGTTV